MSEWDGTSWSGTIPGKAETGPFVANITSNPPLSSLSRSPQKRMKEAQSLYHSNPWVRVAESVVTRKTVGLPWHLEDGQDEEIPENTGGEIGRIRMLLEKPQAALPPELRQEAVVTRRGLWSLTSRHVGLCGMSYWYLDQMRGGDRTPLAILYVNPARVWPVANDAGQVSGWVLDAQDATGRGGTPLERDELIPFYLDPPDSGPYGAGLVEAAWQKASITNYADRHGLYVLGTGGRLAGIVSPKEGTIPPEEFAILVNEFRNANEAPDAAKRTTIVKGPIDFTQTAADPQALSLIDLGKMNRDDILAIWGVPPTQAGIPQGGGLNSGETRKYDEAVLMQGSVHDRVLSLWETIQYRLLDRWQPSTVVELEIEEPEFDDRTPLFELASKSLNLPLTNEERRALVGMDPTGEEAFDKDVLLPVTLVSYAPGAPEPVPPEAPVAPPSEPFKAAPKRFLGLRKSVDTKFLPALRKTLSQAFAEQARAIAETIRSKGVHFARKPKDTTWWNAKREDERLAKVLRPSVAGIAETVTRRADDLLRSGKADFETKVVQRVMTRTGERIKGINQTTRDSVAAAIEKGFDDGLSPGEVADLIEGLPAFDESRAELVARTESMFAYNDAALSSYGEFGVTEVEAIDGDQDEECAARNGQTYLIEDAQGIEDHPNGTLDWVPIVQPVGRAYTDHQDAFVAAMRQLAQPPVINVPPAIVSVEPQPAPIVNVEAQPAPVVNVPAFPKFPDIPAPVVNVDLTPVANAIAELKDFMRRPVVKDVLRDADGRILRVTET